MKTPIKQNILKVYGREPETLDELARCVIAVINRSNNIAHFDRKAPVTYHKVAGLAWDIKYRDLVSNSHSSPEGYPQNWGSKEDLPKGYPGWYGRVWIRFADECKSFGSDVFGQTLTHVGTGGGGAYDGVWEGICRAHYQRYGYQSKKANYPKPQCYSWDFRFYNLDWPALDLYAEQQMMWSKLSGTSWNSTHRFEWNDPETLIKDAEFIAECATIKAKETA